MNKAVTYIYFFLTWTVSAFSQSRIDMDKIDLEDYARVIVDASSLSAIEGIIDTEDCSAYLVSQDSGYIYLLLELERDIPSGVEILYHSIRMSSFDGIYVYSSRRKDVVLYQQPDLSAKSSTISEYIIEKLRVDAFSGKWLHVFVTIEDCTFSGWIPPEDACSNPESTCS